MFLACLNQELYEIQGRVVDRKPLPSIKEVFSEVRTGKPTRKIQLTHEQGSKTGND